jgi:hypothetical protein
MFDNVTHNRHPWKKGSKIACQAVLAPITIQFEMWRDRESGRMSLDLYWRGWNQSQVRLRAIALARARNEKKTGEI